MKEMFSKLSEKMSETAGSMMEGFENMFSLDALSEKFSSMSDATREKYVKFNNDLIALSPIIERIGFKTTELELSMGIPPSFVFHFEKIKETTPEEREAIMNEHKDNPFLKPIVKMLVAADDYREKIKMGSFRLTCIEVTLGLTPGVTMKLTPTG